MITIFILVLAGGAELVIHCLGGRWCEAYSLSSFRHLLAAGALECFFEVVGTIKIYRRRFGK